VDWRNQLRSYIFADQLTFDRVSMR